VDGPAGDLISSIQKIFEDAYVPIDREAIRKAEKQLHLEDIEHAGDEFTQEYAKELEEITEEAIMDMGSYIMKQLEAKYEGYLNPSAQARNPEYIRKLEKQAHLHEIKHAGDEYDK
jgi:hypothetical protein